MQLIIAERPSVAQSIAAVMGATERKDGYAQNCGLKQKQSTQCTSDLSELDELDFDDEDERLLSMNKAKPNR